MDFGRVKTLLIIVFLLLNLFLGYQWQGLQQSVSIYAEPYADQVANLQRTFSAHNITMKASVPQTQPTMFLLRVQTNPGLFLTAAAAALDIKPQQASEYSRGSSEVKTREGRFVMNEHGQYRLLINARYQPLIPRGRDGPAFVRKWLAKHVVNYGSYGMLSWKMSGGKGVASFAEVFDGYPIFSAPLRVYMAHDRITGYFQTALEITGSLDQRSVIGAASALLALAVFVDKAHINMDNTIQSVRLGYDSRMVQGHTWYVAPVWQVDSSRSVFEINAFTAETGVGAS